MKTHISRLGPKTLHQTLELLKHHSDHKTLGALSRLQTLYLPFHQLNHILPLKFKFLPCIYVATQQDTVIALLWLSQDGETQSRWRIDEIIINPNAETPLESAEQLVQHAMTELAHKGVEAFMAYIPTNDDDALALFKACGFRHATRQSHWQLCLNASTLEQLPTLPEDEPHLPQEHVHFPQAALEELYAETLPPEVRINLRKMATDLRPRLEKSIAQKAQGHFFKSWALPHQSHQYLLGYLALTSADYKTFELQIIVCAGLEHQLSYWITTALKHVGQSTKHGVIEITTFEFQKSLNEALKTYGFERQDDTEVLVKDYWTRLTPEASKKSPVLFLGEKGNTSPA